MTVTRKVRIGIWGCGGYAGAHARRLQAHPHAQVAALCDISEANMRGLIGRRLAEVTPAPALYTDPAAMFAGAALDGVVIATPHSLHYAHAVQALEAGCHVFVEKPMVTRVSDAHALAGKVRATGRLLLVGYNTAYTPACQYVREAVRGGTFGRLELVCGYLAQDWKRLTSGSWRHDPELSGGGQACDSGAHLLNTLCWCVESPVAEVFAIVDRQETAVDINTVFCARFASGTAASIAIGGNSPPNGSHTSFIFDGGRIDVDGWCGEWLRAWRGTDAVGDLPACGGEANPDRHFVEAILGRAAPLCTVEHGVIQCELTAAVYASARTGTRVTVAPPQADGTRPGGERPAAGGSPGPGAPAAPHAR